MKKNELKPCFICGENTSKNNLTSWTRLDKKICISCKNEVTKSEIKILKMIKTINQEIFIRNDF